MLTQGLQGLNFFIQDFLSEGVITPTAFPFKSPIWPILKPGKNTGCFTVDDHNLNAVALSTETPPLPISNVIEITDSIQSATSKYFATRDLANMFCSVPISTASQPVDLQL